MYITDRSRAATNDFIILFCAAPSVGVGQENEIATQAGVPAIRLVPNGISRMMKGSFLSAHDITYGGSLSSGITFSHVDFLGALREIRKSYFRFRALYKGPNGDAFGSRLRRLIDDRCGDYEQCSQDLGISLSYLNHLLEEPFAVSNPSIRLLQRLALRLGERVGYLIGETDDNDPVWIDSRAAWRLWINNTSGIDAVTALKIRDEWDRDYASERRQQLTNVSHRRSLKTMKETDWDKRYQAVRRAGTAGAKLFD